MLTVRCAVCSEVGNYDRVVIQEILKEIAQTQQVDLSAKQKFKRASMSIIRRPRSTRLSWLYGADYIPDRGSQSSSFMRQTR